MDFVTDLGPHAGFIISAYVVTALVVALLILWVAADHLAQKRALADLERRGITRRSAEPRPAPIMAATDQAASIPWAILPCAGCNRVYRIGDDAVAVSLESAYGLVTQTVILVGDSPAEPEDLVSTLRDVSPDTIQAARNRARPSWETIQTSIARGDRRKWRCHACNAVNTYPSELRGKHTEEGIERTPTKSSTSAAESPVDVATATVTRAFERHLQRLEPQLRGEPETQAALNKVAAVFRQTSRMIGEKVALSATDEEMHSFSFRDRLQKIRLEVTTIPCQPHEACDYFSRIPPGGYAEFLNRLLYFPSVYQSARAEGIQVFAHLVVVVDSKGRGDQFQRDRVVVHLCMLPHGDGNQSYCPVGVTPTDLLKEPA